MKKVIILLIALIMLISLSACGCTAALRRKDYDRLGQRDSVESFVYSPNSR